MEEACCCCRLGLPGKAATGLFFQKELEAFSDLPPGEVMPASQRMEGDTFTCSSSSYEGCDVANSGFSSVALTSDLESSPLSVSRHLEPIPLDPFKDNPSLSPYPLLLPLLSCGGEELFKS